MMVYTPLEYLVLTECRKMIGRLTASKSEKPISCETIEQIAFSSENPAFRSKKFRLAFISYQRFGLRPKRKIKWTLTDAVYYSKHSYHVYLEAKKCASL